MALSLPTWVQTQSLLFASFVFVGLSASLSLFLCLLNRDKGTSLHPLPPVG